MGTRLLSEHMIRKSYPHLRYVRIHTTGNNKVTIYAWDDDLQLSEKDMTSLKKYASGHLLQHVCYKVKSYDMVQTDQVPQVDGLPEPIVQAAMNRSLDLNSILEVINEMFSNGRITFSHYDVITGTIHFELCSSTSVTDIEKDLLRRYLYEITPLGAFSEVTYFLGQDSHEQSADFF